MPTSLGISQELLDRLIDESIGKADIGDDRLVDKTPYSVASACPTTTVNRTFDC